MNNKYFSLNLFVMYESFEVLANKISIQDYQSTSLVHLNNKFNTGTGMKISKITPSLNIKNYLK